MTALKLKIQITCGAEIAMGPGKADLLDAIAREGSISGAGRLLGMSYRRAWQLVDVMNRCWNEPLVITSPAARTAAARASPRSEPTCWRITASCRPGWTPARAAPISPRFPPHCAASPKPLRRTKARGRRPCPAWQGRRGW
jgi:molybdate transport system regulatory protein